MPDGRAPSLPDRRPRPDPRRRPDVPRDGLEPRPTWPAWSAPTWSCPAAYLQPEPLTRLIEAERITATCGVPTIWMDVLRYADEHGSDLSAFELAICGGTQVPPQLMRDFEAPPRGRRRPGVGDDRDAAGGGARPRSRPAPARRSAGRAASTPAASPPSTRSGSSPTTAPSCPATARAQGEIQIRGPAVAGSYFEHERGERRRFTTTAGCGPATSARSTGAAGCGSPTAPRT